MMLGDVATWLAMMTAIDGAETALTLEMKTNFLGPGVDDLRCVGRVVKSGRRTVFCEANTRGATGKPVAFHTITYLMT
jgi:acyl-coenzyme A thioesterase PaaI-like protein